MVSNDTLIKQLEDIKTRKDVQELVKYVDDKKILKTICQIPVRQMLHYLKEYPELMKRFSQDFPEPNRIDYTTEELKVIDDILYNNIVEFYVLYREQQHITDIDDSAESHFVINFYLSMDTMFPKLVTTIQHKLASDELSLDVDEFSQNSFQHNRMRKNIDGQMFEFIKYRKMLSPDNQYKNIAPKMHIKESNVKRIASKINSLMGCRQIDEAIRLYEEKYGIVE